MSSIKTTAESILRFLSRPSILFIAQLLSIGLLLILPALTALRPRREFHRHAAQQGLHRDLMPQHGVPRRDPDAARQIVPFDLEHGMRRQVQIDVEVASPVRLARQADLSPL